MRERTTWNRDRIASLATKLAEDPRAMNQDHLQQQPSATKYETGGPSEFAEDVHESGDTWKAEYQGDEVRRNEIGMPEFRPDTFKTAEDHDFLVKKADLAVEVARSMLGKTASDETVVAQALSFMTMSNEELINTANRMANDDEEEDEEEAEADEEEAEAKEQQAQAQQQKAQGQQQAKQAQQQEEKEAEEQDEEMKQAKKAQQQEEKKEAEEQEEKKQAQGQQQQAKQAQQQEEKKEAEDEEEEDDVQKQASKLAQAMCQMSQEQQQQLMSQMQQWMQGQQQPMEQQVQVQQDMPMDDEQLLSQMLEPQMSQQQPQDQMMMASDDFEIELEAPAMGLDLTASSEDEVLRSLFAADLEEEEEEEKPAKQASTPVRTASTRTVGTRPSQGVSKLGGRTPSDGGDDVAKLSNLWSSAPDVTGVFR